MKSGRELRWALDMERRFIPFPKIRIFFPGFSFREHLHVGLIYD